MGVHPQIWVQYIILWKQSRKYLVMTRGRDVISTPYIK